MWEILGVLRRVGRGENNSAVARATGHSRKTVGRYVQTAVELGWSRGSEEPSEDLAAGVYARHRPAAERNPGEAEARLLEHLDAIRDWLKVDERGKRCLTLAKVRILLGRQKVDVPYSTLHHFAVKHCGFGDSRRITVRMADCEPGEVAEVNFGKFGLIPYADMGRRRTAWALIVTLGYSRHQYVHVTFSQKIPDLISGLEDAWVFFGGVTARVVIDNMKAAVTKADRYDPIFARTFEEYARYRGFVIDAAPARMPTAKPVVERNVQYARETFFRGEDPERSWDAIASPDIDALLSGCYRRLRYRGQVGNDLGSEQHQRQPQREQRTHEDDAHEAHRAEGLLLYVGDAE